MLVQFRLHLSDELPEAQEWHEAMLNVQRADE
jgi:hypothetical protein